MLRQLLQDTETLLEPPTTDHQFADQVEQPFQTIAADTNDFPFLGSGISHLDLLSLGPAIPEGLGSSLAALATHVWRTKGKMVDATTGEPKEESRRAYRHVEASLEALGQMGVTINDWMDQPYDPGLPVKVLTFQPHPGVTRDTVIEAVKPTVIWREQLLQLAEVVVGIPGNTENS